jgi:hypothetical protein
MEDATEHLLLYVQKYADLLWKKRYLEVLKGVDIDDPTTLPHDQPDLHDRKTSDELKRLSRLSLDLRQARKSLAENEHAVRMAVRQTLLYETERDVVLLTRQYGRQLSIHLQDFATYLELYVTSSGAITSLMLLMLARLGVIKDALDDKIEKRWEDWQEAQQEFVKEQMKACQQDGESMKTVSIEEGR